MAEVTTQVIDIEAIEVEEGHNPRDGFNEARLGELEASIRQSGLLTALTVRPNGDDGSYLLVAGERRLIAAKRAGLQSVPVVIRKGSDALSAAIAENLIREDLNPIEEANALRRLAEDEKLSTQKQIAERVGKSAAFVSERLRLLKLPDAVQQHIAAGDVPVGAERDLRKVAKVSPRVAECVCQLVTEGKIEGGDILSRFGEILHAVAESDLRDKPAMFDLGGGIALSELVPDPEQHAILAERWAKIIFLGNAEDPYVRFSEADVDAARAAGRLLEFELDDGGWSSTVSYLCDAELAADLASRALERAEKQTAERAKQGAEAGEEGAELTNPDAEAERVREVRRAERTKARKAAEKARTFNLDLGRNLVARRGAATRKEQSLARAKALAELVLSDNTQLAARGLRLVLPQLQEVEVTELKSGEKREKVLYRDAENCDKYLRNRIGEAKSADEVLELLADALIAALLADEREVPQSHRIHWWSSAGNRAEKLLGNDIKAIRPGRQAKRK
jgi:ParB/RepB/Spo0J family partition protein